ncbi:histidine phosphotransferase family protein [Yoonia sp.]|uniref:histidine phosphotransferase family protein n=1 Tax=Yoonia sp. TaxID=2212373 RepID=UPI001A04FDD6|nr:histidine phosphotransferase family protein [Yoonia sp.]MBE0413814.1 histidine phosphotransferase [Yoonia sp.]
MTRTDLVALVGSRICHDLISPIGAIGNGMELISLAGGDPSAELSLISDSVAHANARIRFFRIAYGAVTKDQMIGQCEILSVLAATAKGGRLSYNWHPTGDQPRQMVRMAFLLLQCIETALPLGGTIQINCHNDHWSLVGEGRRLAIDEVLWANLTRPGSSFTHGPAQVQFALLPEVLAENGRKLTLSIAENRVVARF